MLNSFEELCIMRAVNSFPRVFNPHGEAYTSGHLTPQIAILSIITHKDQLSETPTKSVQHESQSEEKDKKETARKVSSRLRCDRETVDEDSKNSFNEFKLVFQNIQIFQNNFGKYI